MNGPSASAREFIGAIDAPTASSYPYGGNGSVVSSRPLDGGYVTATVTTSLGTSELAICAPVLVETDLSMSVSGPTGPLTADVPVTYHLTVTNLGPRPYETAYAFVSTMSGHVEYTTLTASVPAQCVTIDAAAGCLEFDLGVGASATIDVTLIPLSGGPIELLMAAGETLDPNPDDNQVTVSTTADGPSFVDGEVGAGFPLSSDPGTGPSPTDQVVTSVTPPVTGYVRIREFDDPGAALSGYELLGQAVEITAPAGTESSPLLLEFLVDPIAVGGAPPSSVTIFRNGVAMGLCDVAGATGPAQPTPCIGIRELLPSGDLRIVVRTAQASLYQFGVVDPVRLRWIPVTRGSTACPQPCQGRVRDPGEVFARTRLRSRHLQAG